MDSPKLGGCLPLLGLLSAHLLGVAAQCVTISDQTPAGQNRCAHPKTEQEGGKEHRAVRLDIDDRQVSIRAIDGPAPTVGWIHNPYLGFAFVMTQEDVQA